MKEEPKKSRITAHLLKKGEKDLEISSRKQKNLQEKKPKKQKNIQKKLLNRRKKKPKEPLKKQVPLLGQLFLGPNHLLRKRLKLSKRKSSMVRNTWKISWLMLKIWLKKKLLTLKIMLWKKHKMPSSMLKTKLTRWKDTSKEGLKTLKTLWKKKLNKLKKNSNLQQEMWAKDLKTSSSILLKNWGKNSMKLNNFWRTKKMMPNLMQAKKKDNHDNLREMHLQKRQALPKKRRIIWVTNLKKRKNT